MSRLRTPALILTGVLIGAGSVGVGLAATSTATLKACADSKGALVLQSKGRCPSKTKSVKVGVTGPAGAPGAQGIQGSPGIQGVQGNPGQDLHHAQVVAVDAAGTPTASGSALIAAVATITDASSTKRYVVDVGPGVYDLGGASLTLPAYVDLVGPGRGATSITGEGVAGTATVIAKGSQAIRAVSISDTESGAHAAVALAVTGTGSATLDTLNLSGYATDRASTALKNAAPLTVRNTVISSLTQGTTGTNGAVTVKGIDTTGFVTLYDTTVTASGQRGNDNAFAISGSGGEEVHGGRIEANAASGAVSSAINGSGGSVDDAQLVAGGYATNDVVALTSGSISIVGSQVYVVNTGTAVTGGSGNKCFGDYSGTYTAISC